MVASSYTISNDLAFLDNEERRYILTVRDLPKEAKPRERLAKDGPETLSTAELLAVILNVGTTKEEVLTMARRVTKDYGERGIMSQKDAKAMAEDLDIPLGKAAQIVAAAELGRRFFHKNGNGAPVIRTASEVAAYVRDMKALSKEHLRGLYLNAHYKVIHDEVISIGTLDANIIHPRDVFRPALEYAAAAVILVHNHPSGVVDPSEADITVTKQIIAAGKLLGIRLVDHVVVAGEEHRSIPADYDV